MSPLRQKWLGSLGVFDLTNFSCAASKAKTIKLEGVMVGVSLIVLVYGGVTHKSINPFAVSTLGLKVDASQTLGVRLGDGHIVDTLGKCAGLHSKVGELEMSVDAYILEL